MFFSVIIPTYDRPEQLAICLESLNNQRLDRHTWEVIVVDDGSKKNIQKMIENLSLNYSWHYFYQENSGPGKARNTGASKSRGKYLVFLDDDCEADQFWLVNLQKKMRPNTLYGGKTINKLSENTLSETSQLLIDYLYETLIDTTLMFFTTNNFAVDSNSFLECGAFNTGFRLAAGEDREFSVRYKHLGYRLEYAPNALILHSHQLSFKSFLKQHFNYGRSSHTFRGIMKQLKVKLYLDDTCFFIKLILYPFRIKKHPPAKRLVLTCLLAITQVTYASGYLYELIRTVIVEDLLKSKFNLGLY